MREDLAHSPPKVYKKTVSRALVRRRKMAPHKFANARRMRLNPTPAERVLWQYLKGKALGVKIRRQSPMWGYIADFYAPAARLVIEVDGEYHQEHVDATRDAVLLSKGLRTLRLTNAAVLANPESAIATIREHLHTHPERVAPNSQRSP